MLMIGMAVQVVITMVMVMVMMVMMVMMIMESNLCSQLKTKAQKK
jgi:hypothetical protein